MKQKRLVRIKRNWEHLVELERELVKKFGGGYLFSFSSEGPILIFNFTKVDEKGKEYKVPILCKFCPISGAPLFDVQEENEIETTKDLNNKNLDNEEN